MNICIKQLINNNCPLVAFSSSSTDYKRQTATYRAGQITFILIFIFFSFIYITSHIYLVKSYIYMYVKVFNS